MDEFVPLYYVAHPAAPPCACEADWGCNDGDCPPAIRGLLRVRCNVMRAKRWLRWLVDAYPHAALVASWMPYVDVLPDQGPGSYRERGLRDCEAVIARCDALLLVGGRISAGMEREIVVARRGRIPIHNLIHLGAEPPQADGPATAGEATGPSGRTLPGLDLA